jgi:hypothetical protein
MMRLCSYHQTLKTGFDKGTGFDKWQDGINKAVDDAK